MNVCIVIRSVIPVRQYGGTQRVMWGLGKALAEQGHKVTFLASGAADDCPFGTIKVIDDTVDIAKQIPADTDVVHFNDRVSDGFDAYPYIVTIHGNKPQDPIPENAVFVSRNHAKRFASESYVYNGLDWSAYPEAQLHHTRKGYHFLGKGAWRVKNLKGCIRLTKAVPGATLEVMGADRINFKMGFRLTLTPRVHFHGMVDDHVKAEIASKSAGLLFPVLWDEPFGLAVIESLYYGSPVYATPHGSLPELITPETGVIAATYSDMLQALLDDRHFDPEECHHYAATHFDARTMADAYVDKYHKVISGCPLNQQAPHPLQPYDKYKF